ncbi:MAG: hypothetical protein ACQEQ7_01140 [Thermodesulfobacteriota bacterium]
MKKELIKPFGWGMVVGAVVILIIIFATGFVTTSSSAKKMAEQKTEEAVEDRLASICVTQFKQDLMKDQKLEALKEQEMWKQGDYVEKQGWATMPGEDAPDPAVAEKCANKILELQKEGE